MNYCLFNVARLPETPFCCLRLAWSQYSITQKGYSECCAFNFRRITPTMIATSNTVPATAIIQTQVGLPGTSALCTVVKSHRGPVVDAPWLSVATIFQQYVVL
jgi:hypothetical protein